MIHVVVDIHPVSNVDLWSGYVNKEVIEEHNKGLQQQANGEETPVYVGPQQEMYANFGTLGAADGDPDNYQENYLAMDGIHHPSQPSPHASQATRTNTTRSETPNKPAIKPIAEPEQDTYQNMAGPVTKTRAQPEQEMYMEMGSTARTGSRVANKGFMSRAVPAALPTAGDASGPDYYNQMVTQEDYCNVPWVPVTACIWLG